MRASQTGWAGEAESDSESNQKCHKDLTSSPLTLLVTCSGVRVKRLQLVTNILED